MGSYLDRMQNRGARVDRFGSMQAPREFKDFYKEIPSSQMAEGLYPARMLPTNPSKFPEQPTFIRKHGLEVEKGEKLKMILGTETFYPGLNFGDPHQVIDRLLLGLNKLAWVVEEQEGRDGKKYQQGRWDLPKKLLRSESFMKALGELMPKDTYQYLLLIRAYIKEIKPKDKPQPGVRVWKKYRLEPAGKDMPVEEWVPIILDCRSKAFFNDFIEAVDGAMGYSKKFDPWDRQSKVLFNIKAAPKGKGMGLTVRTKLSKEEHHVIGQAQWKELLAANNYPDLSRRLGWMTKDNANTDESIIEALNESHWFQDLLDYVPDLIPYLEGEHDDELEEEDEDLESDDDDEEEDDD